MAKYISILAACAAPSIGAFPPQQDCTEKSAGPVLGGVDFVDLMLYKNEGQDAPELGSSQFNASLNGYTFWFKSAANQGAFAADPWKFAPAYGGF